MADLPCVGKSEVSQCVGEYCVRACVCVCVCVWAYHNVCVGVSCVL